MTRVIREGFCEFCGLETAKSCGCLDDAVACLSAKLGAARASVREIPESKGDEKLGPAGT